MTIQSEVDARVLLPYATATLADLERGAAYCEKLVRTASLVYTHPAKRARWQHHADLLRAEIARRKGESDAEDMKIYATATIEDLEFVLKNAERAERDCGMYRSSSVRARNKDIAMWQHHADLLRAEIARRREVEK